MFCSSPAFALWSCSNDEIAPEKLVVRIDYLIGLHKFAGPSAVQ